MALRTVKFKFDPGTSKVNAGDLVRAIKTLLGAAGELQDWQIRRMTFSSPLNVEALCQNDVYEPMAKFSRQMAQIDQGKKPRGGLTGEQAKILDSIDAITRGVFGSIQIAPSSVAPISLNRESIDRARQVTGQHLPSLSIHRREQMGQLRGYLEQITARKGQLARFGIRDRVSGDLIFCIVPEGDSEMLRIAAASLAKRVTVSGLIHYGDQSRPTSIRAQRIEVMDEYVIPFNKLPRVALTEDGDSVGLVRRLRDG